MIESESNLKMWFISEIAKMWMQFVKTGILKAFFIACKLKEQKHEICTPMFCFFVHTLLIKNSVGLKKKKTPLLQSFHRYAVYPSEGSSVEVNAKLFEESHPGPCIL